MEAGYPPFNWTQADDSNGAVAIKAMQNMQVDTMYKSQRKLLMV